MKNKKIGIEKIIIVILICIIISLVIINLNNENNNIEQQLIQKEQLGETTGDNAYIEMQTHTSELHEQEQKLVSFKSVIANTITDMGIETSANADANTMANNIKNISKSSVSIVATGSGNTSFTLDSVNMTDTDVNNYILQPYYAPSDYHYVGWIDQDNQFPYVSGFTASLTINNGTITISGMQVTGGHQAANVYTTVDISWRLYHI